MLLDETAGRNVPRNENVPFKISTFIHMSRKTESKEKVICRTYIYGLQCQTFSLKNPNPSMLPPPTAKAYPDGVIPINTKKIADIRKLMPYIPDDEDKTCTRKNLRGYFKGYLFNYCISILNKYPLKYIIFTQDGTPCFTSEKTKTFLKNNLQYWPKTMQPPSLPAPQSLTY